MFCNALKTRGEKEIRVRYLYIISGHTQTTINPYVLTVDEDLSARFVELRYGRVYFTHPLKFTIPDRSLVTAPVGWGGEL